MEIMKITLERLQRSHLWDHNDLNWGIMVITFGRSQITYLRDHKLHDHKWWIKKITVNRSNECGTSQLPHMRITTTTHADHKNHTWGSQQPHLRITTTTPEDHNNHTWGSQQPHLRITTTTPNDHNNHNWGSQQPHLRITTTTPKDHNNHTWGSQQPHPRITTTTPEDHNNLTWGSQISNFELLQFKFFDHIYQSQRSHLMDHKDHTPQASQITLEWSQISNLSDQHHI